MKFLPPVPEGNDEVPRLQNRQMFRYGLSRHIEVLTELAQGLAIVAMQLIEQRSTISVGKRFEDCIHVLSYAT